MKKTTKSQALTSVKWTSLNTIFNTIITPIFYVILPIILTPEEFAYIAVLTLVFRLFPIVGKFGIEQAYIQRKHISALQNSSILMVNLLLSLVISLILFFASDFIEAFYSMESLSLYIKVMSVAVFFESVAAIFRASLKKQFKFKSFSIVLMFSMFLRVTLSIVLILMGYGIIGFAIGFSISTIVAFLGHLYFSKVGLSFSKKVKISSVLDIIKFGLPVTMNSFVGIINQRADEIIIGAFFSPAILGVYFFGKNLMMQVRNAITTSFSEVLLPLYSNLASSTKELKRTYYRVTKLTSIVGFPILVGISMTASLFVPLIFGNQWQDSIIVIQVLFIGVILPVVTGNNAISLLYSLGRPSLVLYIETILSIVYLTSLWIVLYFYNDISSVLTLYFLFLTVHSLTLQHFSNKGINSNLIALIRNLKSTLLSIIIMIFVIYLFKNVVVVQLNLLLQLCIVILAGGISYLISVRIFDYKYFSFLLEITSKEIRKKIKF